MVAALDLASSRRPYMLPVVLRVFDADFGGRWSIARFADSVDAGFARGALRGSEAEARSCVIISIGESSVDRQITHRLAAFSAVLAISRRIYARLGAKLLGADEVQSQSRAAVVARAATTGRERGAVGAGVAEVGGAPLGADAVAGS